MTGTANSTRTDTALPKDWRWGKLGEIMASKLGSVAPSNAQDEVFTRQQ